MGAWDALDKLGKPDEMSDSEQFEKVKTVIEVCKVSGVNFPLLCTHTIDIAIDNI